MATRAKHIKSITQVGNREEISVLRYPKRQQMAMTLLWTLHSHVHDAVFYFLLGLLFTVLLALKMDRLVSWSWHRVAVPIYIGLAVCRDELLRDLDHELDKLRNRD